ncbi:MAG TPA: hypothetical protein VFE92_08275, partial [Dermatophilaceae bacterium]|nr:hypothetical protein [Dermatophilaceae bacterium]
MPFRSPVSGTISGAAQGADEGEPVITAAGSPTGIEESLLTSQEALLGVSNFAEKRSGLSCVVFQCASTWCRTASSCVDVPRAMRIVCGSR